MLDSSPSRPSRGRPASEDDLFAVRLDPGLTFDRFVVGHPNRLAYVAARQIAEAAVVRFNPLYIFGGVGLGKTHLLQAVAWEIRRRDPQRRAVYMSAEHFMYRFIKALREKNMLAFKEKLRAVDVLLLDDLRFIANKESTQEEFLHTFNALMEHNRQMVIAADCAPSQLDGVDERLRSRLAQGLAADVRAMDFELRLDILVSKAAHVREVTGSGLEVPHDVIRFLAENIVTNVRVLEGALNRLVAHALLIGKPISLDMAKERLADILRTGEPRITIDQIQRCVAMHFNIRQSDMLSRRRPREIARPRQVAMYLCKQLTTRSLVEIGRKFGGRDHTTVLHAVRTIERLRVEDAALGGEIEALTNRLSE